jgi:hypothetical protein
MVFWHHLISGVVAASEKMSQAILTNLRTTPRQFSNVFLLENPSLLLSFHRCGLPEKLVGMCTRNILSTKSHLSVSPQRECVVSLPGLSSSSGGLVVAVSLAQTTRLLTGRCEATSFAVLNFVSHMLFPTRVALCFLTL